MAQRLALAAAAALLLLGSLSAAAATPEQPHILLTPVAARPTSFVGQSGGPALPTVQEGIGPGSALQQHAEAGDPAGFICTAAFLLRDPTTATYYLSTAGHCVVRDEADPTPYTGAANPGKVNQEIDICVAQCIDNALSLGSYLQLKAESGYQPVAFGQSGGVGEDFGIIQLPAALHDQLRPWMPQFGGPTGQGGSVAGDTLVHYGHGSYCCPVTGAVASRTPADQGRVAVSLGPGGTSFSGIGSISGGDSGSGISVGVMDANDVLRGTDAVGVITHSGTLTGAESLPTIYGTLLAHGLEMVKAATGLSLELVQQGDPLPTVPTANAPAAPRVVILTPLPGATVAPGGDGGTVVEGSAGLGNQTPPAGALVQLAVDDPEFGIPSRVPVAGNDTWLAQWDLHGVTLGDHVLYARLVAADGTQLAAVNQTVTVAARGTTTSSGPSGTSGPSHPPSSAPGSSATSASGAGSSSATTRAGLTKRTTTSHGSPLPTAVPVLALVAVAAALRRKR